MRQLLFCSLVAMCWQTGKNEVHAQVATRQTLSIGDVIPSDLVLENVVNYHDSKIVFSELKGKAIVFDFFTTYCIPCVRLLPKLEDLQKQFGSQLQVIVVTPESPEKIQKFLTIKQAKNITLPFIVSDSILRSMFPHNMIPHEVLINSSGQVSGITHHDYLTSETLRKLIAGEPIAVPFKQDILEFDKTKPFYTYWRDGILKPSLSSTIVGHLPGVGSGFSKQYLDDSLLYRTCYFNLPIISLYEQATGFEIRNRLLLTTTDSSKFFILDTPESIWVPANSFCYELVTPSSFSPLQRRQLMLETLNNYFLLSGKVEKRKMSCLAIVCTDSPSKFISKGGKPFSNLMVKNGELRKIINKPLSSLIIHLNYAIGKKIILDETRYTGNVDIEFSVPDLFDYGSLKKNLLNYGLDLISVEREIEMLVLTEH